MNVETRKSAVGTEYWDAKEKRVRFVPAGQKPDFEVTEKRKSMIVGEDNTKAILGPNETVKPIDDEQNLESMTVKELKVYAAELSIDLPEDIKKKDDIIKYLSDGK